MKYLLIHCIDETSLADGSEDEELAEERAVEAWVTEMEASGVKLSGGALRPVSEAKTVRVRGGEVLVSDGLFAETKEQIAGFDVLECANLDEAIEAAARHPTARDPS
jgi:hypothetical protein